MSEVISRNCIIREAEIEDIDEIANIEKRCFRIPWSMEVLLKDFTQNRLAHYTVAELEGEVVGYIGVWLIDGEVNINNVAVLPEFRKRHIATGLLRQIIAKFEADSIVRFTLEVRVSNQSAINLYEKFGFKMIGTRKNYYQDNKEDALIMWRGFTEKI